MNRFLPFGGTSPTVALGAWEDVLHFQAMIARFYPFTALTYSGGRVGTLADLEPGLQLGTLALFCQSFCTAERLTLELTYNNIKIHTLPKPRRPRLAFSVTVVNGAGEAWPAELRLRGKSLLLLGLKYDVRNVGVRRTPRGLLVGDDATVADVRFENAMDAGRCLAALLAAGGRS